AELDDAAVNPRPRGRETYDHGTPVAFARPSRHKAVVFERLDLSSSGGRVHRALARDVAEGELARLVHAAKDRVPRARHVGADGRRLLWLHLAIGGEPEQTFERVLGRNDISRNGDHWR